MTYLISGSIQPTSMGDTLNKMKNLFKQAGFTVVSSSDGTTLVAGDSATSASLNNTNAYFIVKQPLSATGSHGGWRREWGFQKGSNSVLMRVSYTVSTEHAIGGTASTMPSGSDRRWVFESQSGWNAGSFGTFVELDLRYWLHIGVDNAAPYGWWMVIIPYGNPGGNSYGTDHRPTSCMIFDPLISGSYSLRDLDPVVHYSSENNSAGALFCDNGLGTYTSGAGTQGQTRAWFALSGSGSNTGFASGVFTCAPTIVPRINDTTNQVIENMSENFFEGTDDFFPVWYVKPIINTTNFVPVSGIKGVSSVMTWNLVFRDSLTNYTVSSSRDKIVFGNMVFPWNGTVAAR